MIEPSRRPPENRIHIFDPVGLINDSYASHVIRPRKPARSPNSGGSSPVRFAVEAKSTDAGGDSDSSSPRLWKSPSPDSRTQAIARGRIELMEMIKDMPESSYELSLRDIVDQKSPATTSDNEKNQKESKERKVVMKRSDSKKKVVRSRSIDNGGFLLKTSVFPISFWLNKNKKKSKNSGSNKRKSGGLSEGNCSSNGGSTSSSRSSSSNSGSIRQAQNHRFLPDCLSFKAKK